MSPGSSWHMVICQARFMPLLFSGSAMHSEMWTIEATSAGAGASHRGIGPVPGELEQYLPRGATWRLRNVVQSPPEIYAALGVQVPVS